jgi:hypothetical protein
MKEAYLLLRSSVDLDKGGEATPRGVVITFDHTAGPYAAILKARGSLAEVELLARRVGAAPDEICWLSTNRVEGGAG